MAGGSDEVEQRMNAIIAEAGVTLDTGLLCENIVVLSLKIANNLTEAFIWSAILPVDAHSSVYLLPCLVINLVSEARCIDDSQGDAGSFFIQFQFCSVSACA